MSAIFGGSKSKSKQQSQAQSTSQQQSASWNDAYPGLAGQFNPLIQTGLDASDFLGQLLGLRGGTAAQEGFDRYKDASGYEFIMDSGQDAISGNAAARGLLNSGATAKALTKFGQNTASQFYNNYLDRLLGLSTQGIQAGGLLGSAGQRSYGTGNSQSTSSSTGTSSSSSKPGIGGFLGQIGGSIAASERHLKTDISRIGRLPSGIGIYRFRYIDDASRKPWIGVMVDEVEKIEPEALGPVIDGNRTVNYDNLSDWRR